ncbi:MAG: LPS export ABC transporter periplasmic protein LptC [Pseudomonadota bacterium]
MRETSVTSNRQDPARSSYATALQHSKRVRFLKVAFPVATLIAVALVIGSTMISNILPEGASVDSAAIAKGKLVMSNPVMTGQIGDDQGYSVKATRAIQDLAAQSVIRLEDIVADFPFNGSETAMLSAISGIYDRDEQFLSFDEPFTVTTDAGMTAELSSAFIDIGSGKLSSDKQVRIDSNQATLVAQSMILENNGATITFENGVRMTIKPGAVKPASAAEADGD